MKGDEIVINNISYKSIGGKEILVSKMNEYTVVNVSKF